MRPRVRSLLARGAMLKVYDKYLVQKILVTPIRLFGGLKLKDKIDALYWLRDRAEISDLEYVYPLVFEKKLQLGLVAAEVVHDVMTKTIGKQWGSIYDRMKYLQIDKDSLTFLMKYPETVSVHLLGIATLNSNGYVREKALRILSGIPSADVVPYVLLRVYDWVEPIRAIACHVLRETLTVANIDAFITNVYLIDKMKNILRVDLNSVKEEIITFLKNESVIEKIKDSLRHPNIKTRLFCYSILEDRLSGDKDIVNAAVMDKSFEVRLWLVGVISKLEAKQQHEVIKVLLHDKSAKVKVVVLRSAKDVVCRDFKDYILELACDQYISPREEARYIVKSSLMIDDIPNFYRERIRNQPSSGAILGLGETGCRNDYVQVSEFSLSEDSTIRCAAMTAMWRLSEDASVEYILSCLDANIPRVRKNAKRLLKNAKMYIVLSKMKEKLIVGDDSIKIYALEVIYRYGGWQALESILWVISKEDDLVLSHAINMLERWIGKAASFYTRLDNETEQEITDYLIKIKEKNRISEKILKQLDFIVQIRK